MTHEAGLKAAHSAYWDYSNDLEGDMDMGKAIKAYLDASGTVLVPRKPTQEMTAAWDANFDLWFNEKIEPEWHMWNVMLDAAPNPFKSKL